MPVLLCNASVISRANNSVMRLLQNIISCVHTYKNTVRERRLLPCLHSTLCDSTCDKYCTYVTAFRWLKPLCCRTQEGLQCSHPCRWWPRWGWLHCGDPLSLWQQLALQQCSLWCRGHPLPLHWTHSSIQRKPNSWCHCRDHRGSGPRSCIPCQKEVRVAVMR